MILWLARHTKTTVPDGVCYGCTDVELPEDFAAEAASLVDSLRSSAPARVYSSPLRRCRALAELIGPAQTDPRLAEMNFGRWEMRAWNSIDNAELEQWRTNLVDWVVPQGESVGQLARRTGAFLEELRDRGSASACVVTHAGVIRVLSCLLWRQPLAAALDVRIPLGSALRVQWDEGGAHLLGAHGIDHGLPAWMQ